MLTPSQFVSTHLTKLDNYITGITTSAITANNFERLAVSRFLDHKSKYIYKHNELIIALKFFSLCFIQIKNEARQCELMDFQLLWLASIVALYRTESERLYSQSFILVSKKNSKSTFAALLSLYFTIGCGVLNAHTLMVGASREQARTLINYVEFIVKNSPVLVDLFQINKNIIYNQTDTSKNRIEIRSSEAGKINSVGVGMGLSIVDEFAYHSNAELQQAIKSAQIAQPNHHQLIISTASNNLTNPAFELYEASKNILEGITSNDDLFCVVYTLDSKDEYKDRANYRKANPAIGHTVTVDALEREVNSCIALPQKLETVLNHHFNIWHNQHQESFVSDDLIKELMIPDKQIPTGSTVWLGFDGSSLNDLSAISVLWFDQFNRTFVTKVHHIFPNNERRRIKQGSIDLQRWIDDGYITQCQSESLDENLVIDLIRDINNKYKVRNFGYDPFNARMMATRIKNEIGMNTTEVRQNFTMSFPLKFIEKYISEHRFFFDKSPVTRWQFQNVRVKTDRNNNYMIMKHQGQSVDGIVSTTVAMTCWLNDNFDRMGSMLDMFEDLQTFKVGQY
jgi:phage terminase large subunit-like protein